LLVHVAEAFRTSCTADVFRHHASFGLALKLTGVLPFAAASAYVASAEIVDAEEEPFAGLSLHLGPAR